MFEKISLFQMSGALARHGAARQALTARNVANADTPGYKARDVGDFSFEGADGFAMRRLHRGHLAEAGGPGGPRSILAEGAAEPNGNTVSLEEEMLRGVQASREHQKALTIYRSSLRILRAAIGRG